MNVGVADSGPANRGIPALVREQVKLFTFDALHAKPARRFDLLDAFNEIGAQGESSVVAVDIGGDKMIASPYRIAEGRLHREFDESVHQGNDGFGYLDALEALANLACRNSVSVGISFAGPVDGTRLLAAPNLPILIAGLYDRYGGDFKNLFTRVVLANDAEAGLIASALEAAKRYPDTQNLIYVINGSGLGGAVLKDDTIFATEPGHIPIEQSLNPLDQSKPCGLHGASHVCVESVAASKAGIEDLWLQQKKEKLSGREIATRYLAGDPTAAELYDNSALVTAHVVKGLSEAFGLPEDFDRTVVVGHGGIFQVPGYCERLCAILTKSISRAPRMIFTKDFSDNACLDGAAIIAAMGEKATPAN